MSHFLERLTYLARRPGEPLLYPGDLPVAVPHNEASFAFVDRPGGGKRRALLRCNVSLVAHRVISRQRSNRSLLGGLPEVSELNLRVEEMYAQICLELIGSDNIESRYSREKLQTQANRKCHISRETLSPRMGVFFRN